MVSSMFYIEINNLIVNTRFYIVLMYSSELTNFYVGYTSIELIDNK